MCTKTSSLIASAIIDGNDLIVELTSGKCFRYAGAGDQADPLAVAPSKGAYFNTQIKGKYAATEF